MSFGRALGRAALIAGLVTWAAGPALAHDEDWRKLEDKLPRVEGPIWTLGDPVLRDDTFDAAGVTRLAWIPLNNFPGTQTSGNDCWGYTSPSGREYAIMGLSGGYGFVEITNPVAPNILGVVAGPDSLWHDIKVIGDRAYGVSEGGSGIQVIDLSDIDNGNVTLVQNKTQGGHTTTHNIVANTDSGYLYLCGANIANGGLVAIDATTDPDNPTIAGSWSDMYVHDAQVVSYTSGSYAGREIAFCAAGLSGGYTQTGLRIVDVTDKSNMHTIASLFYTNASYAHQVWLSQDRQTLYLNDELDEGNLVTTTTTRVIDVSDINNPQLLGTFTTGLPAIDHNLYTRDQYIFETNYRSGLRVFDGTDPLNPVEIAHFDTFPGSDAAEFNGSWSNYPFFPSGNVIVSDIERGLFVLRIDAIPSEYLDVGFENDPPAQLLPGTPEPVVATITESLLTLDPATVMLNVSVNGGPASQVPMTGLGSNRFGASIPGQGCFDEVTTFVTASATNGASFQSQPTTSTVFTAQTQSFADNAETDLGWTVSGTALDGQWDRGVPVNAGRGDPPSDYDGSGQAYLTDNSAANGGNSDVDSGTTILTSPTLDISEPATISYAYWYADVASGTAGPEDHLLVEYSPDDGANWFTIRTYSSPLPAWRTDEIEVGTETPTSATFRVRFTANDDDPQNVIEAGMDAFAVTVTDCVASPACSPADLTTQGAGSGDPGYGTPDGAITAADLNFYVNAYVANDTATADVTTQGAGSGDPGYGVPDGMVTAADINYFVNLYLAGCP